MLVVVGGHSRNIGKTSVVAGLIRELPEACWTALKITQHGHGPCPGDAQPPYTLTEETGRHGSGDSARYLAAGARRSYWLRTATGRLGDAVPAILGILDGSLNAILESNSVLQFFQPDLYLLVLDFSAPDFKESARRYFHRTDALVIIDRGRAHPLWTQIPDRWMETKTRFHVSAPRYSCPSLIEFVRRRLSTAPKPGTPPPARCC